MTTMYSIHKDTGQTVIHQLPWSKESKQLDKYLERGFTFEPPTEHILDAATDIGAALSLPTSEIDPALVTSEGGFPCPECGKTYQYKGKMYRKHLKTHKE